MITQASIFHSLQVQVKKRLVINNTEPLTEACYDNKSDHIAFSNIDPQTDMIFNRAVNITIPINRIETILDTIYRNMHCPMSPLLWWTIVNCVCIFVAKVKQIP